MVQASLVLVTGATGQQGGGAARALLAAATFATPGELVGRTLDPAGDVLSGPQIATAIGRATGRPLTYTAFPEGQARVTWSLLA